MDVYLLRNHKLYGCDMSLNHLYAAAVAASGTGNPGTSPAGYPLVSPFSSLSPAAAAYYHAYSGNFFSLCIMQIFSSDKRTLWCNRTFVDVLQQICSSKFLLTKYLLLQLTKVSY